MNELNVALSIEVGIYYYVDEETDELVFDTDSMRDEFEDKLNELLTD
jgi:hypothetical protein